MNDVAPLCLHEELVRPEWLDSNGHMNLAYYVLAFDHATDKFLDHIGMGPAYTRRTGGSIFVLETHVVYRQEMLSGEPMRFTTQLLGHDAKRMQFIHHMYHAREGYLAAAQEIMALHVALETRRGAPFMGEQLAALEVMQATHDRLPRPPEAGRAVGLNQGGRRGAVTGR
jgi:acyl-CoA thioester hydrolase